jgi:hypothetical protein
MDNLNATVDPMRCLMNDRARVMEALVIAMRSSQNLHQILQVADTIIELKTCKFDIMMKEIARGMTEDVTANSRRGSL